MKILIKREIQQLALIQMSEIDFKDFMKLYKDYAKKLYSFLVNTTLVSNYSTNKSWKQLIQAKKQNETLFFVSKQ